MADYFISARYEREAALDLGISILETGRVASISPTLLYNLGRKSLCTGLGIESTKLEHLAHDALLVEATKAQSRGVMTHKMRLRIDTDVRIAETVFQITWRALKKDLLSLKCRMTESPNRISVEFGGNPVNLGLTMRATLRGIGGP